MFILYVFKKNNFCHIRRVYNSPANFRYFNRIGINSILFLLTQSLVPNLTDSYIPQTATISRLTSTSTTLIDTTCQTGPSSTSTIEIGHRTLDPPASNRKVY